MPRLASLVMSAVSLNAKCKLRVEFEEFSLMLFLSPNVNVNILV